MSIVKAYERINQIKSLFYDQLTSYGYKDILIVMYPTFYSKEDLLKKKEESPLLFGDVNLEIENDKFCSLTHCSIYFWDKNIGYQLFLCLKKNYFPIDSDNMTDVISQWSFILNFLQNRKSLQYTELKECEANIEIKKQLVMFLKENNFNVHTNIDDISMSLIKHINLDKNQKSYSVVLDRIYNQIDYSHDFNDEPIEYNYEDINRYENIFKSLLEKFGFCSYIVQLYPDFGRLSVQTYINGIKRQIDILSYHSVLYYNSTVEEIFKDILGFYLRNIQKNQKQMVSDLINNDFHIYSCSDDCSEIFVYKYSEKIEIRIQNEIVFDDMEGHQFESFCAKVLMQNGFENVKVTRGSGDQGIDIIAYKDDIKYGIQCKCYHSDIGNKAVQEVYAGKNYYNCDVGVVITNRYFTKSAIELAKKNRIHLWDRKKLLQLLENYKESF